MRLTVADLDAEGDLDSSHIERLAGFEDDTASVLYIPLPAARRLRGIDNMIAALPGWALRNRLTVISVHPWRRPDLDDDALDDIARRTPGAPLYVLDHDEQGQPRLTHSRGQVLAGVNKNELTSALRTADVKAILMSSGVHLPQTSRLHYEGPNGHHYGAFLRPGFAVTTSSALDRISFWLLPHMRGRTNIVVDHWSMLAMAHHAVAYAARKFQTNAEPFIESLRRYDETSATLGPRLRRAFPTATKRSALFLLSINSSGSMAFDVVLPSLELARQTGATAVALASASGPEDRPVAALAELDDSFRRHRADDCSFCREAKPLLPLDKDSYLLKLAAFTEVTAIRKADANQSTDVIQRYKNINAFTLHRDYDEGSAERHHAFYVDILPMLDVPEFKDGLRRAVESIKGIEPTLIICPPSRAAVALARMVAQHLELETVIISDERGIYSLSDEQREQLCKATDILLVDDVVITGTRIEGFRQELIALRRSTGHQGDFNLGCIVGVARARDNRALQGCKDFVHHREGAHQSFAAVETLYLPHWDERSCPWCRELRALKDLPEEIRALELVANRISQLHATSGLANPFFSTSMSEEGSISVPTPPSDEESWQKLSQSRDATVDYSSMYWELNPGSVFGNVQGADLVVSVAAAVHSLRGKTAPDGAPRESRLDRRFRSPVSKVLDPDLYLFGRFYEPVILASILRVCNEWDVRSPDVDDDVAEGIEKHLEYLSSGSRFTAEALVLGRLGRLPSRTVKSLPVEGSDLHRLAEALL